LDIRVKVLYFGQAREAAGTSSEGVVLPEDTRLKTLVERSKRTHGGLARLTSVIALNEEVALDDAVLADGDVVAFLPPVTGG
jgi:sulfur-carrier protein